MRTRTLTDMLADIRQRTNQENSSFVTDAELTGYLNTALADVWTRLVLNAGQPFYRNQQDYSVTPSTPIQALPSDFWTMQEVTCTVGGETWNLHPFMASEHGALMSSNVYMPGIAFYRIQGNNIEFRPATRAFTATIYYSPVQPNLVNPSDTFDGFAGYEMAAIYDVCATVLNKEESDPGFYTNQRDRIFQQIDKLSAHRDMSSPERVQEVRTRDDLTDFVPFPGRWV